MLSDNSPFYAASIITDSRYFVGYKEQLKRISERTVFGQPTSINIVGNKRIGKSSLLYHFWQTYEELLESQGKNRREYLAVYVSFKQGNCQNQSSFYQFVAKELSNYLEKRFSWFGKPRKLMTALKVDNFDAISFYDTIALFKQFHILPILCLDEIETLFKYPQEFDNGFYDNLRSLIGNNKLMLIIASRKNLQDYSRQKKLTSSFFNPGHIFTLEGLTENEARDLVRLPHTTVSSSKEVLNEDEQKIALEWGGRNPYLLQLAGLYLWEAQQNDHNPAWAKKRFERQAKGISRKYTIGGKCLLLLKWIFWYLPIKLGRIGKLVISNFSDVKAAILGWAVIIIFLLVLFQKVPLQTLIDTVKKVLGL